MEIESPGCAHYIRMNFVFIDLIFFWQWHNLQTSQDNDDVLPGPSQSQETLEILSLSPKSSNNNDSLLKEVATLQRDNTRLASEFEKLTKKYLSCCDTIKKFKI